MTSTHLCMESFYFKLYCPVVVKQIIGNIKIKCRPSPTSHTNEKNKPHRVVNSNCLEDYYLQSLIFRVTDSYVDVES